MDQNSNKKTNGKKVYLFLAILFGLVALISISYLVYRLVQDKHQKDLYEQMQNEIVSAQGVAGLGEKIDEPEVIVVQAPVEDDEVEETTEEKLDLSIYDIPDIEVDFEALKAENPDVYAWINIPDTIINYPVLQREDDLDYYLTTNFDGSLGRPGCIYSQYLNQKDFSDFNTVFYGHNMGNGTMFQNLHYFEDSEFFDSHPYVYIFTEDGPIVYEVFAAYQFPAMHLLFSFNLADEEIRKIYIQNIYDAVGMSNNYRMDVEVTENSNILTLSTCVLNKEDKRFLVAAVMVADGRGIDKKE